jgi:hypothetical protein
MRIRRPRIPLLAGLLASGLLAAPAVAASTGGAAPGAAPAPPAVPVRSGDPLLTASAHGVTISMRAATVLPGRAHVHGTLARAGRSVRIERLDAQRGWVRIATATARADRTFDARWQPGHGGVTRVRAVPVGAHAGAAGGGPELSVALYRRAVASWYGPDAHAAHETTTACGIPLRATTLGLAHRTLPCGTPVALTYRGRTLVVPVIDRGPFAPGRTWDLTAATFQALDGGDAGLIRLGALPLLGGAALTTP